MQNKKLITLVVLVVLAIFSLIYGIVTPSRARRQAGAAPSAVSQNETAQSPLKPASTARPYKRTAYTAWGRNPFLFKATPAAGSSHILSGILWDERGPRAIIGNRIVSVGDNVAGSEVVSIKEDRVILHDGEKNLELKLK